MGQFEVLGQSIGRNHFFVIGGPCVIESEDSAFAVALFLKDVCERLNIPVLFKSSYDKANRTSLTSYRGPGLEVGLSILSRIRRELRIPVLTDVHSAREAVEAGKVVDVIQVPAFLARQTEILTAAGKTGKPVNLKKAQFLAPWDMRGAIEKVRSTGNECILLTERGTSFGYNNLVVDMRSIPIMRTFGCPVVFDATHSVQIPGGRGDASGGERQYVAPLARAAVAAGADGIFLEMHEDPDCALCDGPNSIPLKDLEGLLEGLKALYGVVRG